MTGRIDIAILRLLKLGCDHVQNTTGVDLWEKGGVERVAQQAIKEWKIPTEPVDIPMTLARNVFGILPQAPRGTQYTRLTGRRRKWRRRKWANRGV